MGIRTIVGIAAVVIAGILLIATIGTGQHAPETALGVPDSILATYTPKVVSEPREPAPLYPDTEPDDPDGRYDSILFSGMEWHVKHYSYRVGPQYNYFSNLGEVVWVDEYDRLHLMITERDGQWRASEVYSYDSLGYGTYVFYLDTPVGGIDQNTVLGLFLYGGHAPYYNEIDIEIMHRYGLPGIQYVVQPAYADRLDFTTTQSAAPITTLTFTWAPGSVHFAAYPGYVAYPFGSRYRYASWAYEGDVPEPNGEHVHLNFYLYYGRVPSDGESQEIVIRKFIFIPYLIK